MNKDYLPSKKFVSRIIIIVLLLAIAGLISKISPEVRTRIDHTRKIKGLSVKDLVQVDSNKNGIADWEESLFGLDPKADGAKNKEIIDAKRKELGTDTLEDQNLSENDKLSRELFSIISSLDQTGNLNEGALKNLADALDVKVSSDPIKDIYSKNEVNSKATNTEIVTSYYNEFGNLAVEYADKEIGQELVYISQGLLNQDKNAMNLAREIADSYESFGKKLMEISPVPSSIVDDHVNLSNSYHKTAMAIDRMTVMLENPLLGMNAVADYKNFSDSIVSSLEKIGSFFEKSVIIER